MATILVVCSDLMLQSRVREQAQRLGYDAPVADTLDELSASLDVAALLALDLHVAGLDWRAAAATARERGVPVLAFGRHTEPALLREARDAGVERVVARSTLVEELPALIVALVSSKA
jgi:DNA-binding response OmpR family regulator